MNGKPMTAMLDGTIAPSATRQATRTDPPAATAGGSAAARLTQTPAPAPTSGAAGDLSLPMRFLVIGLATLALLTLVYPWHLDVLRGSFYDPHLLTFVHVNTLGVIGAVIFGATYQMLPIVLQTPLAAPGLARLSWWLYLPGLISFVIGLGHGSIMLLSLGGSLVFAAVSLYIWVIAGTLRTVPTRDTTWWHVAAATTALATGASLGLLLALSKHVGFLAGLTLPTLAAHVTLMLGGWVTPLLTGVAYRLVSMFTLTEDRLRSDWATLELRLTAGRGLDARGKPAARTRATRQPGRRRGLPGRAGRCSRSRYCACTVFACAARRTSTSRSCSSRWRRDCWRPACWSGALPADAAQSDPIWLVVGWLAIVGWAQTAIQGFLYKIGPFLTWLHRYGPVAGLQRVPMLEQMYSRRLALVGCIAWSSGLVLGALTPLTSVDWLPLAAALSLSLSGLTVIVNGVRIGGHWLSLGRH